MADLNTILNQRIKKSDSSSKMAALAKQSATGNLTSFAGVFSITELNEKEKNLISELLKTYASDKNVYIDQDLEVLLSITSEIKAINNQAILLHGERIKKAHAILTHYRDGAFTNWLIAAYGNRQTPYNLMQYYDFYQSLPKQLRPRLESMPRQAIYTLASRTGSLEKKQEVVENYQGESKLQIIELIRHLFPLQQDDKRQQKLGDGIIQNLQKMWEQLKSFSELSSSQKDQILDLLQKISKKIEMNNK